jgi:hypothetical protein
LEKYQNVLLHSEPERRKLHILYTHTEAFKTRKMAKQSVVNFEHNTEHTGCCVDLITQVISLHAVAIFPTTIPVTGE